MRSYESPFSEYLHERDFRSRNSPEGKEIERINTAISSLSNLADSLVDDPHAVKVRESIDCLSVRKDPSSATAVVRMVEAWMKGKNFGDLEAARAVQLKNSFLALIDFATLRRSSELAAALKDSRQIFDVR